MGSKFLLQGKSVTPRESVTWLINKVVYPLARLGYQNERLARIITDVAMRLEDVREAVLSLSMNEIFWKEPLSHSKVLFERNPAFI